MSATHTTIDATHAAIDDWQELASRDGDGLEVALLWSKTAGRVKVTVADSRLDEAFELDIAGADALAAFHHPFAYAGPGHERAGDLLSESIDLQPHN